MNPGGTRAPILDRRDNHEVTYSDIFTVQPFGNIVVTITLTGEQIIRLLEEQWPGGPNQRARVLLPSANFTYKWDNRRPAGSKLVPGSVLLEGVPIDPKARYRVAVNNFLADGGDAFTVLREGVERVSGMVDLDALEAYFKAHSPVAVPKPGRIVRLD